MITGLSPAVWSGIGAFAAMGAAGAASVLAAWSARNHARFGVAGPAITVALALSALWAAACAVGGRNGGLADLAEVLRNLAWLFVVLRLFGSDQRNHSVRPVRPMLATLAAVEAAHLALLVLVQIGDGAGAAATGAVFQLAVTLRLLVIVGGLMLVHNLYAGASSGARIALRWPAAAIAVLWLYDLNFYTVAYLIGELPAQLAALRGAALLLAVGLLALGTRTDAAQLRFGPSRSLAFQSASLGLIGAYLAVMIVASQWLAHSGANFAAVLQLAVVLAGVAIAAALLASRRLRGWARVSLTKHLFRHRYDYRAEWLRFTRTIGRGGPAAPPLHQRVIQAVAEIADCDAGLLLTPDDDGDLLLAARWQWPTAEVPAPAMARDALGQFERGDFIVDLDAARADAAVANLPAWLRDDPRAWALVPLTHFDRLVGVVVIARPRIARKLDWEDFDLLRVVGRQLASYLAEHAGQDALAEAGRFDDFNRRIAFVMHDIKNLASQMALLARNAELHADNPAFRADMLLTLRNSAEKLNALLARLSRYGAGGAGKDDSAAPFALDDLVAAVVARFAAAHPVILTQRSPCAVSGNGDAFEQALSHLIQNAIDASDPATPVFVSVLADSAWGSVEVLDSGTGMSADFIRAQLFKPFVSSKSGGFGIGAFEARELIRAMGGRLDVESREGLGTRMVARLPLGAASDVLRSLATHHRKVA